MKVCVWDVYHGFFSLSSSDGKGRKTKHNGWAGELRQNRNAASERGKYWISYLRFCRPYVDEGGPIR